jgi:hypothetical protein
VTPGRGGRGGPVSRGGDDHTRVSNRRTSPSHLFLPFLQAVQALAPLLGMCAAACGGCDEWAVSAGDWLMS